MRQMKSGAILLALMPLLAWVALTTGLYEFRRAKQARPLLSRKFVRASWLVICRPKRFPTALSYFPLLRCRLRRSGIRREVSRKSLSMRGTLRWTLAAEDANLTFPQAAGTFSCALNAPITEQDTPHLYILLRRARTDASFSTNAAKDHYNRTRPFVVNKEPTCAPADEKALDD